MMGCVGQNLRIILAHNRPLLGESMPLADIVIPSIASIAASFAGARYAFLMERQRREREDRQQQVATLNSVLATISWYRNRIYNIRTQVVEPVRGHPYRHVVAQARLAIDDEPPVLQRAVSQLPHETDLLDDFFLALSAIAYARTAFRFLEIYSNYHLTEFQPRLADVPGMQDVGRAPAEEVSKHLPFQVNATLGRYFDELVSAVDEAREKLLGAEKALWNAAKSAFPGEKFVHGCLPDDPATVEAKVSGPTPNA